MSEVPGVDRDRAREEILRETPLVPADVQGADDDPRSTDEPTHRGDDGQTGESVKPRPGSTDLGT